MPWRVVALVGSLIFVSAAPAAATTYCVAPATGCGGGDLPNLGAALTAASTNAGADDVRLGATTYTDGPWSYEDFTQTNPVTIRGAGQLDSRLTTLAGGPTLTLVNGSADNVLVYGPTAGPTAPPRIAVKLTLGRLSNSQVLVSSGGLGVEAASATVDHSSIVPAGPGPTGDTAILADNAIITDTSMSTTNGVEVLNQPVAVRRATIVTKGHGLQSNWDDTAISDSLIVLDDPTAVGVQGVCDLTTGTITIDATNLTVTGAAGGTGIAFRSIGGQGCGGHVAVSSSLVQGVGTTADCAPGIGTASVTISYSDADLGAGEVTGTCTGAVDAGTNFFADPKLAGPATLQPVPRFDSPLVDAGDPAAPGAGQPTGLAGLPRAVNGRRDIGAFEYGRRAPLLSVAAGPATVGTGEPVTFTATTSDPDLGDTVTVGWNFDDGATAIGDQVTHAFAAAGIHTATATATDSAGVTTVQAVTVTVTASGPGQEPPPPETKDTTPPETEITKHPKKRTKKRKAVFAFSSSESGASFECKLDMRAPAPCTSRFAKRVRAGRKPVAHGFSVVAIDAAGNRDATSASYSWKVRKKG